MTARGRGCLISSRAPLREGGMVWYGMVEVCEGAPVAVSGWVLTDRHDLALAPCAANSRIGQPYPLISNNVIGGTGTLGIA